MEMQHNTYKKQSYILQLSIDQTNKKGGNSLVVINSYRIDQLLELRKRVPFSNHSECSALVFFLLLTNSDWKHLFLVHVPLENEYFHGSLIKLNIS